MKIGIDFDNTIIDYGKVFHKYAVEYFGLPSTITAEKQTIRSYLWSLPDGNTKWTELQGIVYGDKIQDAAPFDGLDHFLRHCKALQIDICIISHKSVYPSLGPKVNLHDAASGWLDKSGFFNPHAYGLSKSSVFFESTRLFKVMRIGTEKCSVFIDDLTDVFEEKSFPQNVQKILFSHEHSTLDNIVVCGNWNTIENFIFNNASDKNQDIQK